MQAVNKCGLRCVQCIRKCMCENAECIECIVESTRCRYRVYCDYFTSWHRIRARSRRCTTPWPTHTGKSNDYHVSYFDSTESTSFGNKSVCCTFSKRLVNVSACVHDSSRKWRNINQMNYFTIHSWTVFRARTHTQIRADTYVDGRFSHVKCSTMTAEWERRAGTHRTHAHIHLCV